MKMKMDRMNSMMVKMTYTLVLEDTPKLKAPGSIVFIGLSDSVLKVKDKLIGIISSLS